MCRRLRLCHAAPARLRLRCEGWLLLRAIVEIPHTLPRQFDRRIHVSLAWSPPAVFGCSSIRFTRIQLVVPRSDVHCRFLRGKRYGRANLPAIRKFERDSSEKAPVDDHSRPRRRRELPFARCDGARYCAKTARQSRSLRWIHADRMITLSALVLAASPKVS